MPSLPAAIADWISGPPSIDERSHRFHHGFSGELRDQTGLLPYGFRTHDPASSRWLSPDPIGRKGAKQSPLNFYQMVDSNPVSHRDSRGLAIEWYQYGFMREDGRLNWLRVRALVNQFRNQGVVIPKDIAGLILEYVQTQLLPNLVQSLIENDTYPGESDIGNRSRLVFKQALAIGFERLESNLTLTGFMNAADRAIMIAADSEFDPTIRENRARHGIMHRVLNRMLLEKRGPPQNLTFRTEKLPRLANEVVTQHLSRNGRFQNKEEMDRFLFTIVKHDNIWKRFSNAYFEERDFLRQFFIRGFYELGFTSLQHAFNLTNLIMKVQDDRFSRLDGKQNVVPGNKCLVALDFDYSNEISNAIKKQTWRGKVHKKKNLSIQQVSKIRNIQKRLLLEQQKRSKKVDRSAIPQDRVFLSNQFKSWGDYLKQSSSVPSLYKKRQKIKKLNSSSIPKKLPGTEKKQFKPHLAGNRDKFKFAYPEFHVGLSTTDRNYIMDNMQRNIWASLQFGATGRHVSKVKGVHHEHLMPNKGVFAFTYIDTGLKDPAFNRPIARAIVYNYARETAKNSTNVLYKWTYQPDFRSPGNLDGGPPPVPFDLKYIRVGARPPKNQTTNTKKPPSKKKNKSKKSKR